MALFGNESEDVQKTLLKVQAALALTQGLNSVLQLGDAFKNLKVLLAAGLLSTQAMTAANTELAVAQGVAAGSARALAVALTATGIGAIVVAVGLLVAGMYKLSEANDEAAASSERLVKSQENFLANQKLFAETFTTGLDKILDARNRELQILVAQGASEKDLHVARMAQIEAEMIARRKAISEGRFTPEDEAKEVEILRDLATKKQILEIEYTKFLQSQFRDRRKMEDAEGTIDPVAELIKWEDFQREKTEVLDQEIQGRLLVEQEYYDLLGEIIKKENAKQLAEQKAFQKEITDSVISSSFEALNNLTQAAFDNKQAMRDQDLANQIAALDEAYNAEVDYVGASEATKKQVKEKYRQKERELKKRAWEQEKQAALSQILIQTALAVVTTFAKLGYPAGIPAAIAAGVAGAAEYAIAASQPIPQFAKGTLSVPGINQGKDTVHAMLMPGEAVIPTATNQKYSDAIAAIYKGTISPAEINNFVKDRSKASQGYSPYDFKYAMNGLNMNLGNADYLAKKIGQEMKMSSVESKMLSKRLN